MSMNLKEDKKAYAIMGCAMRVHRILGDGFLESAYGDALEVEFARNGIPYVREDDLRFFMMESRLTRLSTFASKTPAVAGVLLLGLHYTVDLAASAASPEIFGGGWAGNASPSRSSRIARSGFGST